MRKKREWTAPEENAESHETAAFEATVAAAQDMAAKSGEFLSDVRSDLNEHQRWLQAQTAAVERDRKRHERWLQRQRDHRAAVARKERVRGRRRVMRRQAVAGVSSAFGAALHYVRSVFALAVATVASGIKWVVSLITGGVRWVVNGIASAVRTVASAIAAGTTWVLAKIGVAGRQSGGAVATAAAWSGSKASRAAMATGRAIASGASLAVSKTGAALRTSGSAVAAGSSIAASKVGAATHASGSALATGSSAFGAKVGAATRASGAALAAGSSAFSAKAGAASRAASRSVASGMSAALAQSATLAGTTSQSASRGFARASHRAAVFRDMSKRKIAAGYRWTMARVGAVGPALYVRVAKAGRQVERYAKNHAPKVDGIFAGQASKGAGTATAEIYGPHLDGQEVGGRPANVPWVSEVSTPEADIPSAAEATVARTDIRQEPDLREDAGPLEEAPEHEEGLSEEPVAARMRLPDLAGSAVATTLASTLASTLATARDAKEKTLTSLAEALSSGTASARERASAVGWRMRSAADQAVVWTEAQTGQARTWLGAQPWTKSVQRWAQKRDADLSQMMIIAGTVLLVCGVLLVGGGLLMRGGGEATTSAGASDEASAGISWAFDEPALPLPDRAVFTLSGTPSSFKINGLSIGGANLSDEPLSNVYAVLKPDVQRPDLRLALEIESVMDEADGGESLALEAGSMNTIPSGAGFRLVFQFPTEALDGEDGLTVDEYFESYGGLLLKLQYELDGIRKSLIHYLPPDLLKAQLDEVSSQAADS